MSAGVLASIGVVEKHSSFLFNQTKPWEVCASRPPVAQPMLRRLSSVSPTCARAALGGRLTSLGRVPSLFCSPVLLPLGLPHTQANVNNGYPNVVYDPADPHGAYRLWYNALVGRTQAVLYANSTDGIVWQKPDLGLVDAGALDPALKPVGRRNNIVLRGGGVGVYRDTVGAAAAAGRFKAIGALGSRNLVGDDTAVSADGLAWTPRQSIGWHAPQRDDTHNNVFWDAALGRYVATTRDVSPASCDARWGPGCTRNIAMAASAEGQGFMFDAEQTPPLVHRGTAEHQLYAQVTFRWHSVYLAIVMVYDASDPANRVHCRLAWSQPGQAFAAAAANANATGAGVGWRWVDAGGLTGRDFIPLNGTGQLHGGGNAFDSHLCFAAPPVHTPRGERLYYMGSNGPHTGSKPHRNASLGLALLRTDGFAGLAGSGRVTTVPLRVGGAALTLTLDITGGGGSVGVGAHDSTTGKPFPGLALTDCIGVASNITNGAVAFRSGATFQSLVGRNVTLVLDLRSAIVYTIGWAQP